MEESSSSHHVHRRRGHGVNPLGIGAVPASSAPSTSSTVPTPVSRTWSSFPQQQAHHEGSNPHAPSRSLGGAVGASSLLSSSSAQAFQMRQPPSSEMGGSAYGAPQQQPAQQQQQQQHHMAPSMGSASGLGGAGGGLGSSMHAQAHMRHHRASSSSSASNQLTSASSPPTAMAWTTTAPSSSQSTQASVPDPLLGPSVPNPLSSAGPSPSRGQHRPPSGPSPSTGMAPPPTTGMFCTPTGQSQQPPPQVSLRSSPPPSSSSSSAPQRGYVAQTSAALAGRQQRLPSSQELHRASVQQQQYTGPSPSSMQHQQQQHQMRTAPNSVGIPQQQTMPSSSQGAPPSSQPPQHQQYQQNRSGQPGQGQGGGNGGQTPRRQRILLTPTNKAALRDAVLSAIRSRDGSVDPRALARALAVGLPRNAVLNAASVAVARERERRRKAMEAASAAGGQPRPPQQRQQQAQAQAQAQSRPGQLQSSSAMRMPSPASYQPTTASSRMSPPPQQGYGGVPSSMSQQQQQQRYHPAPSATMPGFAPPPSSSSSSRNAAASTSISAYEPLPFANGTRPFAQTAAALAAQQRQELQLQQQQRQQLQQQKKQLQALRQQQKQLQQKQQLQSLSLLQMQLQKQQQKQQQQQQLQQQQQQQQQQQHSQQKQHQQQEQAKPAAPKPPQPTPEELARRRAVSAERARWRRVQNGLFLVGSKGGRVTAAPGGLGAVVRCIDTKPALRRTISSSASLSSFGRALGGDWRVQAMAVQKSLLRQKERRMLLEGEKADDNREGQRRKRSRRDAVASLLDHDRHKRYRLQPRKEGKLLERTIKKARSVAADHLCKRHKELGKAIASHQFEFFKFHRLRKADAARLARSIRDHLDKEARQREKDAGQAERARVAALRANDMAAYTSLLEDTKNDRLKFLLDKTDECMNQISSLLQQRSIEEDYDAEGGASSLDAAAATTSYYSSAHIKSEEVRQPSILVGGDLKEYQLSGLQWLVSLYNNRLNGILADEMGLGKTIQTISLIAYLMETKENLGPYLVIVPLSTLSNWVNEFNKWCPAATLVTYKGNPQQRKEVFRDEVSEGHFNVLLTTYEYVIRDKASLRKIEWQYAIVDEGHRMKNAQSKFAVTLGTQYTTRHRVLLTGTPLQNSLPELWALLNFLLPTVFNSVETFDQWFNKPFSQFGSASAAAASGSADSTSEELLSNEERMLIIHRLHELLRPFMLRRVKSEVLDQLPEKVEKIIRCELSSWQKELYKQISASATADKSTLGGTGNGNARGLNNVVMQLRKVCNHPFLFSPEGYHINENIIRSAGKVELLDRMLPKLKAAGHRVLMFTQMTQMMTILEDYFAYRGYASLRLDGSTIAEEREKRMYKFNAPDSPYFIFLLSTRAGGLGLNLATADTVIIFDSDWNPMMDLQAQDRAHRIGQRNDVRVFRIITQSPVEEKILGRATEKLNMNELVVEAGKFDKSSVEDDNSKERLKMMEVLLTDFDTTTTSMQSNSVLAASENDSGVEGEDGNGDGDDRDVLNEMLSSNESDYQLYCDMDAQTNATHTLFTDPNDIPDWIRYPGGKKKQSEEEFDPTKRRTGSKVVTYDDGLTERQFVRLMEKEAQAEEDAAKARKRSHKQRGENDLLNDLSLEPSSKRKRASLSSSAQSSLADSSTASSYLESSPMDSKLKADQGSMGMEQGIPDSTNKQLINICRAVIALKEAGTKRRLSDIFMDKPCPTTYPDYYVIVEKPIAINDILRKCRARLYAEVKEFMADWDLLFANARKYNADGSWVVVDADALKAELHRLMEKNGLLEPPPKTLRIKLSLKKFKGGKSKHTDGVDKRSKTKNGTSASSKKKKKDKKNKKSEPSVEELESPKCEDTEPDNINESGDVKGTSTTAYSDVVGMDERAASIKKRGKIRSGGRGSRGGGGSRGGKGAYHKKTSEFGS